MGVSAIRTSPLRLGAAASAWRSHRSASCLLLCLLAITLFTGGNKVAVIVRAAMRAAEDVVDDRRRSAAIAAGVVVPLEDTPPHPLPRPTSSMVDALTLPGLGSMLWAATGAGDNVRAVGDRASMARACRHNYPSFLGHARFGLGGSSCRPHLAHASSPFALLMPGKWRCCLKHLPASVVFAGFGGFNLVFPYNRPRGRSDSVIGILETRLSKTRRIMASSGPDSTNARLTSLW